MGPVEFLMLVGFIGFLLMFGLAWSALLLVIIYCLALPWSVLVWAMPLAIATFVVYTYLFDRGVVRWPAGF